MVLEIVVIVLLVVVPIAVWRGLFPGVSLRSDYGIRGGWFGTPVTFAGPGSSPRRSPTS